MVSYINGEVTFFLWSILCGAVIMVAYDVFSIFTNAENYSILVCNIFDALFVQYGDYIIQLNGCIRVTTKQLYNKRASFDCRQTFVCQTEGSLLGNAIKATRFSRD